MKKVFMCGFSQESDSFNPVPTTYDFFERYGLFEGGRLPNDPAVKALAEAGADTVCGVMMRSGSGGPVEQSVVDRFLDKTLAQLRGQLPVDGVLVAMHGATQSDRLEDVCGYILEKLRAQIGENVPMTASFDLHANITDKIMKNADFICGFQTYPHIDVNDTRVRAAKLLAAAMDGKKQYIARVTLPMMAPASGYTTDTGKLSELVAYAKGLVRDGKITDYTVFEVQPWLDLSELSSCAVVIAEDEKTARDTAAQLAQMNWDLREELLGEPLMSVQQVIEQALENKSGKPVVLCDSADSPNAGATGDCATVIGELLPYRDRLRCAVAVADAPAAEKAFALGEGAVSDFTLGATQAPSLSEPVVVKEAQVVSLHDGRFIMHGPQEPGARRYLGKTAVLRAGKILIHVHSHGCAEGDLNFYRTFGIEPTECDLVCVKACTSFRAGYEPIAAKICCAQTPGAADARLCDLPFKKRPKPMFPFEKI